MTAQMITLLREFLEEIESLIEADDGTVFQLQHIEMLEDLTDLLEEEEYE